MSNGGYAKKAKTVTRSFRISEDAFAALVGDASREKVSVNTLVNQLFLAYSDYDRFFRRLGMVKISSATMGHLMAAASDEEVIRAGLEAGSDVPETVIMAKEGRLTLPTVVRYIETLSEYSGMCENNMVVASGRTTITLMHRFGPKGSLFFKGYTEALFKSVNLRPTIVLAEHSITIELPSEGPGMSWAAEEDMAP